MGQVRAKYARPLAVVEARDAVARDGGRFTFEIELPRGYHFTEGANSRYETTAEYVVAAEANDATTELPSAMWVTVGLLARDGFALQVKLKRCAKAHEAYRCQRTGLFWVYEPAGGFLTVLDAEKKKNTSPS